LHTFNSNLTYGYVMSKYRSSLNLVMVWWFLAELCPFYLKIIWNFQFPFIISTTVQHIQLKLDIWICQEKIQVKFEFGHGSMIFGPNGTTHSTQTWHMDTVGFFSPKYSAKFGPIPPQNSMFFPPLKAEISPHMAAKICLQWIPFFFCIQLPKNVLF
jgi:hypothetical protein